MPTLCPPCLQVVYVNSPHSAGRCRGSTGYPNSSCPSSLYFRLINSGPSFVPGSARHKEKRGEDSSSSFSVSLGTHPVDTSRPSGSPVVTALCTEVGPGAQPGPAGGAGDQVVDSQAESWRLEGGDSSSCRGPNAQETGCPWKDEQRASWCFLSTGDEHREHRLLPVVPVPRVGQGPPGPRGRCEIEIDH